MSKLKAFFYSFYKSLSSLNYYKDVVLAPLSFSVKYFFMLTILVSIGISGVTTILAFPKIQKGINTFVNTASSYYPDDLIITSKSGQVSINKPEPYIVPFPKSDTPTNELQLKEVPLNLIVFDSNGTLDDMEKYKTLILVNKSNLLVKTQDKIEVRSFKDYPDGTLTKQDVVKTINSVKPFLSFIPVIMFVAVLFVTLLYYSGIKFVLLLPVALLLMLAGNIKKLQMPFSKYLQIALHTFTLPLMVELISMIAKYPIKLPLWFFILNLLFGILVVSKLPEKQTPVTQS